MKVLLNESEFKGEKIHVSSEWTPEERNALIELMLQRLKDFSQEERKFYVPTLGNLERLNEIGFQKKDLEARLEILSNPEYTAAFLECNRVNFKDFVIS